MRVLWISCMLIGSITCAPPQGGSPSWYSSSGLRRDPSKLIGQSSGSGTTQYSAQEDEYGSPGDHQFTEGSWSTSSDTSGEDEPVFTPATVEDQVYAFKSRSRYNKKRMMFTQFLYTPTEPRDAQEPVFPHHGKISQYKAQSGF